MHEKKPLIVYHADCPDGFGAAYAAWKKFGDTADYVPSKYGNEPPYELLKGREVYFVDFCYRQEIMGELLKLTTRLVVLDHHEGVQAVIKSMPEHVYDDQRSGATIAWDYFHPDTPVPTLLAHIEDDDLYRFKRPETRAILAFLSVQPFTFDFWDTTAKALDDEAKRAELLRRADIYLEYFNRMIDIAVDHAHPVLFEGHEVLLTNALSIKPLKSAIGHRLAGKMPPFGLVVSVHPKGLGVSIRGDESIDVSVIARKYGGNGHPRSSGFIIPWQLPMPFTSLEDKLDENPRH